MLNEWLNLIVQLALLVKVKDQNKVMHQEEIE